MRIAIIGTGALGRALGKVWSTAGHAVTYGSRDPAGVEASALGALAIADAARSSEIVVLAVPWHAALTSVAAAGDLAGKVVIDPINAFAPDLSLTVGHTTSVAEQIAQAAVGASVVKAFNTIGASNTQDLRFDGGTASGFICGDDVEAKAKVAALAEAIGFDVVDCGPLKNARALEPLAMLWGQLAFPLGLGPEIAFRLLRRSTPVGDARKAVNRGQG
jgi:predicted dinucleotide-binding enzyme